MQKYSLEVQNGDNWELERDFSSLDRARAHGYDNFMQNTWRIYDRTARCYVHHHDSLSGMEAVALGETTRFAEAARWRQVFAQRDAVVQQRERLTEVAARQRASQHDRDEQRRRRLRGFQFVGAPPAIQTFPVRPIPDIERLFGMISDEDEAEKVNWRKEGF